IQLKTTEQALRVLAPKLRGTQIVYEVFAGDTLDFFVLCSSLSSVLGGFGQIDYSAANCYLDAFAARHAAGETLVVSVNWDTWAEVGMAVETEVPHDLKKFREQSLKDAITPGEGALALDFILSGTTPQVVVSTTAFQDRFRQALHPASVSDFVTAENSDQVPSSHRRQNLSTAYVAPRDATEETIARAWSQMLGIDPIGINDNFLECGGHSLLAIQLVSLLRQEFQAEISVAAFFESPTVAGIAARLRRGGAVQSLALRQQLEVELRKIADWRGGAARSPALRRREVPPERPPLSDAHPLLWLLYWIHGASATYDVAVALGLTANLDAAALRLELGDVMARHESLRTVFPEQDGVPSQQILPVDQVEVPFAFEDATADTLPECLASAVATVFDLIRELPMRTWLFRFGPQRHVLVIVFHHIVADGWSLGPLARDLAHAYAARSHGRIPAFAELAVQYADYTLWQRELLGEERDADSRMAQQLAFWRSALAGAPEELNLPTDRPRPPATSYRGASVAVRLDAGLHRRLRDLARAGGASVFMVLQAGVSGLLA